MPNCGEWTRRAPKPLGALVPRRSTEPSVFSWDLFLVDVPFAPLHGRSRRSHSPAATAGESAKRHVVPRMERRDVLTGRLRRSLDMETIPQDARIFVAGHRGLVGSAVVRALARGLPARSHRDARAARSARSGRGQLLVPGEPARVRLPGRRHGRRHPGQLDAAGRIHLRQHDDPRDGGARGAPVSA